MTNVVAAKAEIGGMSRAAMGWRGCSAFAGMT